VAPADRTDQWLHCWRGDRGETRAFGEQETMMVKLMPRQNHTLKLWEFPGFDPNTKLTAVYFNGGKPPHLFRIRNNVTLSGRKDELDQINRKLNHRDTRRVVGVEYRCPLFESVGSLHFSRIKLTNDDDVRTMFSVFGQHSTTGSIELDASLVRSAEQILKSLHWPRNYEEIRALLEGSEEEVSLDDLW